MKYWKYKHETVLDYILITDDDISYMIRSNDSRKRKMMLASHDVTQIKTAWTEISEDDAFLEMV